MPLRTIVENFIDFLKKEKGTRTYETYGRKIDVFREFLLLNKRRDETYEAFLYRLKPSDIIASVKYYVSTYDISYKSTADTYFSALTVFFNYIQKEHGIKNDYFAVNDRSRELKDAYAILIGELGLNSTEKAPPLTDDECRQLLQLCNEKIDNPSDKDIINGKNNGVYTAYISSLVTKFVLLYGTRNKDLSEIVVDDYDYDLNKITIRKYSVYLPDGLARQMKRYSNIRNEIVSNNSEVNRLFIDITLSSKWENAKMFSILRNIIKTTKATSVAKYAIVQMLKNELPIDIVMDFTGYSKSVCGHCQELIDDESGIYNINEKNRKLDTIIRQSKAFDDL